MIGRNNPFNIRYDGRSRWLGLDGETRGFCNFVSWEYGIRAAALLIMRTYRMNNVLTVSEIIHRFAPPSENETFKYVEFVCGQLSCLPFDIPTRDEYPLLLVAMSKYEGNPCLLTDILYVIDQFCIVPFKSENNKYKKNR